MRTLDRIFRLAITSAHLRLHRVSGGRRAVYAGERPHIDNRGAISLGDRVTIGGPMFRSELHVRDGAHLSIGDEVLVSAGVSIHCRQSVEIGRRVRLAPLVAIIDTDGHELHPGSGTRTSPVRICDDVWIARSAQVLAGVTVGRGAVVAAGSVVTRDVPPATLVAGVPARVVRQLPQVDGWWRT